jgi:hypothetical protein
MNLEAGVEVSASKGFAIRLLADYHPGTDYTDLGASGNAETRVEYYSLGIGVSLRL